MPAASPLPTTSLLTLWRLKNRISQRNLGRQMRIDPTVLGDWERGERMPRLEYALELEEMSDGAVPIESFGYGPKIVRLIVVFRPYLRAAAPVPPRSEPSDPAPRKRAAQRPKTPKRKAKHA